ncbi:malto-oligosyltrehalose synthase [Pontibacter chitinilyticus]|uniref:malto-oligosyltrehalose synthase n=1 Tax=Pontibacter chitinilyticus TaxID=2674989 RepID=UPI003219BF10
MLYIPAATYRLQLSHKFTLRQVRALVPYLHELGISTIYAAPFFCSRPGSEHGYDVTAPYQINSEIGTKEELKNIAQELKQRRMGWLQDIVPNHMAYHPDNVWLMDVLEKGPQSHFYTFFDIDFQNPEFNGQVMVPFLGEPLSQVIAQKQLQLGLSEKGFTISYFDNEYPVSVASYRALLKQVQQLSSAAEVSDEVPKLLKELHHFEEMESISPAAWNNFKARLYSLTNREVWLQALNATRQHINDNAAEMQQLLDKQHWVLCFWQETEKRINYRRFFTVNDLICLSIERPEVFEQYHQFIKQLYEQDLVQGLRVDHIDGLFDPTTYLQRLRQLAPDAYIIVEKILEGEEELPPQWPIQGNSGYDFLAWVSNLYTSGKGQRKLTNIYNRLVPSAAKNYEQFVYEKKQYILQNYMQGEWQNLLRILQERQLIPLEQEDKWRRALGAWLSAFPIYCIYGNKLPLPESDLEIVDKAFSEAQQREPDLAEQFKGLRQVFTVAPDDSEERLHDKLYFVMRSQQFTGPLAAKGVEDTTFYNYNRLLSLNEVGNSPDIFHLDATEFHERMQYKLRTYPHSLNATATHDTKRGEGARVRLNVLGELPEEWEQQVTTWMELSKKHTTKLTNNDLYFFFQTLLGVMPLHGRVEDSLVERLQTFLPKALREAKANTNWSEPNEPYEDAINDLAQTLLQQDPAFMESFLPFFRKIAHYGWLYSLGQVLLKVATPGIPDVYQGCEFWDLSLVDPDNRRPVNYEKRQRYLQGLKKLEQEDKAGLQRQLLEQPEDARVKLYTLSKALYFRRDTQALFDTGAYIPLQATGTNAAHVLAFARQQEQQWCIVVVPLLIASLVAPGHLPLGEEVWQDTAITLPENAPQQWQSVFGTKSLSATGSIKLAAILKSFPVGLITATTA